MSPTSPLPTKMMSGTTAGETSSSPTHEIVDAEPILPDDPGTPVSGRISRVSEAPPQSIPLRIWLWAGNLIENLVGLVSLVTSLAVLATFPLLQVLSLGYLLEASGRVASSGRLRDGFIGLKPAARIGSLFLGTAALILPLRFISDMWYTAYLIDPASRQTAGWRIGLMVAMVLIVVHIVLAWYCGGRLRHFFWPLAAPFLFAMWFLRKMLGSRWLQPIARPLLLSRRLADEITQAPPLATWFPPAIVWAGIRRGHMLAEARDAVWDFFSQMDIRHYFWLGLRGYVGALIWLFLPVVLLLASLRTSPAIGVLAGLIGAVGLGWVLLYLPYLQTELGVRRKFAAMFDIKTVHSHFRRAPIAFWFSLFITLLFAIPLYLLKIEATPSEVTWLPSLVFVAFIFPARLLTGWAVGRARRHPNPRFWLFRFGAALGAIPVVFWYVLIVYFTQFTSWYGAFSLFEQHAFLVPVPFLGL